MIFDDYYYSINDDCIKTIADNLQVISTKLIKKIKSDMVCKIIEDNINLNTEEKWTRCSPKPIYRFSNGNTFKIDEIPRHIIIKKLSQTLAMTTIQLM